MTTYFIARKKWAIRENFSDIVNFLKSLGDADIEEHIRESSTRATYVSTASTDEFHLEEGFLSRLVASSDF